MFDDSDIEILTETLQKGDHERSMLIESVMQKIGRIEDPDVQKRTERVALGIMDSFDGVPVIDDKKFNNDTGWLSRDGKYYSCQPGQHIALSDSIADELFKNKKIDDPEQYLEQEGWAKCTGAQWHYLSKKDMTLKFIYR